MDLSFSYEERSRLIDDDFGGPGNTIRNAARARSRQWTTSTQVTTAIGDGWAVRGLFTYIDVEVRLRPAGAGRTTRSISGVGDTRFWGEYTWSAGEAEWTFTAGLGLRVPTGDPERPQVAGGVPSATLQTGTGTWDPLIRFAAGREFGDVTGFVTVDVAVPVMENRFDTRPGLSAHLTVGAEVELDETFTLIPSVSYVFRDVDRVRGRRLFASGGHWITAGMGLDVRLNDSLSLWINVGLPVARDLVTPTLESNVRGTVGLTLRF